MKIEIVIDELCVRGVSGTRRQIREAIEHEVARSVREAHRAAASAGRDIGNAVRLPEALMEAAPGSDASAAAREAGARLALHWAAPPTPGQPAIHCPATPTHS